ncbi:MAG: HDOD domain-containing protein [Granulosicoccus sp.]|nr:HDOD domain-containing protein [Granulosicoccus sp.]
MNDKQSLISLINERLESGDVELPVFDDIALRIHREVRENKLDADEMCKILEEDPVLVSELLRMANSSFFAGLSPVSNLREAAVRLGVKQIASIVFSVSQKRMYSASNGPFKERLTRLWLHSSAVSIGARWLAKNAGYRNLADEAFVVGLLHDVGKLSLLCIIEDLILNENMNLTDEIVDITLRQLYCDHGARLLEMWNLPDSFKQVVLHQDDDTFDDSNVILCMVRLVNQACILENIDDMPGQEASNLESLPETQALGLSEIDLAELRLVLEDVRGDKQAAAA